MQRLSILFLSCEEQLWLCQHLGDKRHRILFGCEIWGERTPWLFTYWKAKYICLYTY